VKPATVAESYFSLSRADRKEALKAASARIGRPAYLLEKDVWVVWTLSVLFKSAIAPSLTFKGGTSLSKAYNAINRFSEDIDLTCDIREFIPEIKAGESGIPGTASKAKKWSDKIRKSLPGWITEKVRPVLLEALKQSKLDARLTKSGTDGEKLLIYYPPLTEGSNYVSPTVLLEFGARSTGEPHEKKLITCDMAAKMPELIFPETTPNVMRIERTFWEKATAIHVYCRQTEAPSVRFSRHWYDLVEISQTVYFKEAIGDRKLALSVARHKEMFFREKDVKGKPISYVDAVKGDIQLVPSGKASVDLALDYGKMTEAGLIQNPPSFEKIMTTCGKIESQINGE
jgi:hypothetical protein